jgi:hypothetical protein
VNQKLEELSLDAQKNKEELKTIEKKVKSLHLL